MYSAVRRSVGSQASVASWRPLRQYPLASSRARHSASCVPQQLRVPKLHVPSKFSVNVQGRQTPDAVSRNVPSAQKEQKPAAACRIVALVQLSSSALAMG